MKRNSILVFAVITLSLFVACQPTTTENDSDSTDSQTLEATEIQKETTLTPTETVSENIEKNTETVFTVVEESAMFPGGQDELIKYLAQNIKYPKQARVRGVEGLVSVSFVVEKDGSLTDIKLLRDIGSGCGQEALRVVKEMPKWKPAKLKGEIVRMQFNLPVKFTLAY
jgi:protein TonB